MLFMLLTVTILDTNNEDKVFVADCDDENMESKGLMLLHHLLVMECSCFHAPFLWLDTPFHPKKA